MGADGGQWLRAHDGPKIWLCHPSAPPPVTFLHCPYRSLTSSSTAICLVNVTLWRRLLVTYTDPFSPPPWLPARPCSLAPLEAGRGYATRFAGTKGNKWQLPLPAGLGCGDWEWGLRVPFHLSVATQMWVVAQSHPSRRRQYASCLAWQWWGWNLGCPQWSCRGRLPTSLGHIPWITTQEKDPLLCSLV